MENIVHNKYLPADGDELAECTVDWGLSSLGHQVSTVLTEKKNFFRTNLIHYR